jgi:arylsulfatase A-like enzyme
MRSPASSVLLALMGVLTLAACSPDAGTPADSHTTAAPAADDTRPTLIVLVSIDTLRPDHLGLYGYERFTSPILDALAREGATFDDASSTAPWTLPSHASMLTGRTPRMHGVTTYETRLPSDVPTVADLLAGHGYHTGAVVSVLWLDRERYGLTRAFEDYRYIEVPAERRTPSTMVTDQAMEWIRDWKGEPAFLFVHYYDVHSDYASLPEYERLLVGPYEGPADGTGIQLLFASLEDAYVELCHTHFDDTKCAFGSPGERIVVDDTVEKPTFDEDDIRHLKELYDAGIRQMDAELGRFLAFLKEEGLESQTLLIVTSDHGEEFGEHKRYGHFLTTYEEMLHIPLVIRGPGVPAGLRVRAPVSLIDLAPTILGAAGVPAPPEMEGMNLEPLWRGEDATSFQQRALHAEAAGGRSVTALVQGIFPMYESLRRGRYKLVYEARLGTFALYDVVADPGETQDISTREPQVLAALRAELLERVARLDGQPGDDAPHVELSEEDLEQLRALGYVP